MQPSIFKFVFRFSAREQIQLLVFTLLAFPFLYLSLDLPKTIINEAIGGTDFPKQLFDREMEQVEYLLVLCGGFLALVLVNGAFKFCINVYRGIVGERMLRRLRYQLFDHVLRFPLPQFRKMSQGEIVSMITAETEPLGGFIGNAVALPAFQGGTLVTIIVFMFWQEWKLGLAAIALYPLQAYLIPKLQRRLNLLKKERVVKVRKLSERVGETVGTIQEIHTHDTAQYELADYSDRIGEIYYIRYQIYLQKFFIKFINNFIGQITPFFFYSIGGYLVIRGELSFGALVAVLAAYKDLADPWKELLNYYQVKEDARVRYDLLYEQFRPKGLRDPELQQQDPQTRPDLQGELIAANVDLAEEEEGAAIFASKVSFRTRLPTHLAVLAKGTGSGRDRLAAILAGLIRPASGSVRANGFDLVNAPPAILGRQIAYVGTSPNLRAGSLRENLFYSLKHRPTRPLAYEGAAAVEHQKKMRDSELAGNSPYDIHADWIDYAAAGVDDEPALVDRAIDVLTIADMEQDIFELGLQGAVTPESHPVLTERILEARAELKHQLEDPDIAPLVELFDREAYNTNMTVAENLMFGTPRDASFSLDRLADNPYVRKVLHETDIMPAFLRIGRDVAELMLDLFADVEPDSELFEQFSFISAEDLPEFRSLLSRIQDDDYEALGRDDRNMLLALPFRLTPARHRLGLIDDSMREQLLAARHIFARGFGEGSPPVDFFDPHRYNPAVSIQDNILFGRLAYGRPRAAARIGALVREMVDERDLRRAVTEVGLDFQVGIGGARLNPSQRQKLAIARAVLKRPDILIVNEATAALDERSHARIEENLRREFAGRSLIWNLHRDSLAESFDETLTLDSGKVVRQGRYAELGQSAD